MIGAVQQVEQVFGLVDIDMIAGPTELVIIANRFSDPKFIAADLRAQAEALVLRAMQERPSADPATLIGRGKAEQLARACDEVGAGVVIVDPSPIILDEYAFKQRQASINRERLSRLRHTPAVTLDGQRVELLANIELPGDPPAALEVGAVGVGLFRSEFLFMGREGQLPDEEEQYQAYCAALDGMQGLPVTIRTVDIGADKPLDKGPREDDHLNPALGLRAIRWSLADPGMFLTQLRALLRAAALGQVNILFPMLAHAREIRQTLALLDQARVQLDNRGLAYGPVRVGAMIEVPAAALSLPLFLKHFDFLSIGTNDLIQYTLAIDRADESVAHLYDPLHPAVLRLIADTIRAGQQQGKSVSVCGEMAGDPQLTRLLLGMGLRSFSMHPTQILAVKQEVLRADAGKLVAWAQDVIQAEDPATGATSGEPIHRVLYVPRPVGAAPALRFDEPSPDAVVADAAVALLLRTEPSTPVTVTATQAGVPQPTVAHLVAAADGSVRGSLLLPAGTWALSASAGATGGAQSNLTRVVTVRYSGVTVVLTGTASSISAIGPCFSSPAA